MTDVPTEHERRWAGMWKMAQDRYEAVSFGVWQTIADGGSLRDVADFIAAVADDNDWCDDQTVAAYEAAKARCEVRRRYVGPMRDDPLEWD